VLAPAKPAYLDGPGLGSVSGSIANAVRQQGPDEARSRSPHVRTMRARPVLRDRVAKKPGAAHDFPLLRGDFLLVLLDSPFWVGVGATG